MGQLITNYHKSGAFLAQRITAITALACSESGQRQSYAHMHPPAPVKEQARLARPIFTTQLVSPTLLLIKACGCRYRHCLPLLHAKL